MRRRSKCEQFTDRSTNYGDRDSFCFCELKKRKSETVGLLHQRLYYTFISTYTQSTIFTQTMKIGTHEFKCIHIISLDIEIYTCFIIYKCIHIYIIIYKNIKSCYCITYVCFFYININMNLYSKIICFFFFFAGGGVFSNRYYRHCKSFT